MSQMITCIYTDDAKPRRYVSSTSRREDRKLAVELSADPNEAHDFGSPENAELFIPKFNNPFERKYQAMAITVTRPRISTDETNLMK